VGCNQAAVVGGCNAVLNPALTAACQTAGMLTADGRCKTLDSAADGYVRAEACAVMLLGCPSDRRFPDESVSGAANEYQALASAIVVHGSAVNQDGRSTSLTGTGPLLFGNFTWSVPCTREEEKETPKGGLRC
jgi:acyl transferase domain-containing protein